MRRSFIDVKRAHSYALAKKGIFINLPPEDQGEGACEKLVNSMYVTRDATGNWGDCYVHFLINVGFHSGLASPCAFPRATRTLRLTVRGDDFALRGGDCDLGLFQADSKGEFAVKVRGRFG